MASLVLDSGEWTLVSDVTNYSSVGMTYIDLTDTTTWTKVDPNTMVKSTAASGSNYNKITMNAVTGSANNRFAGGDYCDAVRWHTPLYVTNSTGQNVRVTSTDVVAVVYKIERGDITDGWGTNIVAGVCVDPTSTTLATLNGCGPSINHNPTADPDYGVWAMDEQSSIGSSSALGAYVVSILAAGLVQSVAIVFKAGDDLDNKTYKVNNSSQMADGADLFLMVGVGTNSNSAAISEDEDTTFRIQYKAIKLNPS
tara:strand:+ start:28 stop:789 length:762 start_codon:yes stop_codon:yes gene_type:complete